MGQVENTFMQCNQLQQVGDSLYIGANPEYKFMPNPKTGVMEWFKVSDGIPFVRVTPTGEADTYGPFYSPRKSRYNKLPEFKGLAYAEVQ